MSIKVMKQALGALENNQPVNYCENAHGERSPIFLSDPLRFEINDKAITALRQAIEEAEKQDTESLFKFMLNAETVLRLDKEGFHYKGDVVHDAGIAYRLFVDWMKESNNAEKQEPYAYIYETNGPFGVHQSLRHEQHNGRYPDKTIPVYTATPKLQGLTRDEVEELFWPWHKTTDYKIPLFEFRHIYSMFEDQLKEKNT